MGMKRMSALLFAAVLTIAFAMDPGAAFAGKGNGNGGNSNGGNGNSGGGNSGGGNSGGGNSGGGNSGSSNSGNSASASGGNSSSDGGETSGKGNSGNNKASKSDGGASFATAKNSAAGKKPDRNIHQNVRAYRAASGELNELDAELNLLRAELNMLETIKTDSDIQDAILALDPADFETQGAYNRAVANLVSAMAGAPSEEEISQQIKQKEKEIKSKQSDIDDYESKREAAWKNLTGNRNLSAAAQDLLRQKLASQ